MVMIKGAILGIDVILTGFLEEALERIVENGDDSNFLGRNQRNNNLLKQNFFIIHQALDTWLQKMATDR